MPNLEPTTELIILSDLHLSSGLDLPSGLPNRLEQFNADQAFAHFIDYLIYKHNQEHIPERLLFLGDFLDFLHARISPPGNKHILEIDSSEGSAHQKLERIFAGHPDFFGSLGRAAAAGIQIDLVPGNHDIDMIRPAIKSHFIDLLVNTGSQANLVSNIHFFPWLYVVPDLLYAEHGNQYHDLNSFPTLLSPYHPHHPDALDLPLGSYFDVLIHHLIENIGTSDQDIKSPIRYVVRNLIRHPIKLLQAIPAIAKFMLLTTQAAAYRSSSSCAARRKSYHIRTLVEYAGQLGLGVKTVASIDDLSAVPNIRMLLRILRGRHSTGGQPSHGRYIFEAAQSIHKILMSTGQFFPFYVFGHSHHAVKLPLSIEDGTKTWYLNSGTWSMPPFSNLTNVRNTFPFVKIVKEQNADKSTASLLQWNENLKRVEPFSE